MTTEVLTLIQTGRGCGKAQSNFSDRDVEDLTQCRAGKGQEEQHARLVIIALTPTNTGRQLVLRVQRVMYNGQGYGNNGLGHEKHVLTDSQCMSIDLSGPPFQVCRHACRLARHSILHGCQLSGKQGRATVGKPCRCWLLPQIQLSVGGGDEDHTSRQNRTPCFELKKYQFVCLTTSVSSD